MRSSNLGTSLKTTDTQKSSSGIFNHQLQFLIYCGVAALPNVVSAAQTTFQVRLFKE
jgi:hypothetical protein